MWGFDACYPHTRLHACTHMWAGWRERYLPSCYPPRVRATQAHRPLCTRTHGMRSPVLPSPRPQRPLFPPRQDLAKKKTYPALYALFSKGWVLSPYICNEHIFLHVHKHINLHIHHVYIPYVHVFVHNHRVTLIWSQSGEASPIVRNPVLVMGLPRRQLPIQGAIRTRLFACCLHDNVALVDSCVLRPVRGCEQWFSKCFEPLIN